MLPYKEVERQRTTWKLGIFHHKNSDYGVDETKGNQLKHRVVNATECSGREQDTFVKVKRFDKIEKLLHKELRYGETQFWD